MKYRHENLMLGSSSDSYARLIDRKGIIYSFLFEQAGQVREIGWSEMKTWPSDPHFLWLHLDRNESRVRTWLEVEAGLNPAIQEALLTEELYPHSLVAGDGLLVILRGVNRSGRADPDDLVTVRLWLETWRAITLRGPRLQVAKELHDRIVSFAEPDNPGDFLVTLLACLLDQLGLILAEMEDQLDSLEEDLLDNVLNPEFRSTLRRLRRQSIVLRRYIAPQTQVINGLAREPVSWLTDQHRAHLRELADHNLHYVEDLRAMRERIIIIDEEVSTLTSEQLNRTVFVLSIVTTIFLPLSFLTGLLGINVGGIPGATSEKAFITVCIILGFIIALELFFFYHYLKKRQF